MKFISITKKEVFNLDQLRGLNAFAMAEEVKRSTGGGQMTAKKVATQIRENGFLGALAFALERNKDGGFKNAGHQSVFETIRKHLQSAKRLSVECQSTDEMFKKVSEESADELRAATNETIAYMNYLRRFAKPGKDEQGE